MSGVGREPEPSLDKLHMHTAACSRALKAFLAPYYDPGRVCLHSPWGCPSQSFTAAGDVVEGSLVLVISAERDKQRVDMQGLLHSKWAAFVGC